MSVNQGKTAPSATVKAVGDVKQWNIASSTTATESNATAPGRIGPDGFTLGTAGLAASSTTGSSPFNFGGSSTQGSRDEDAMHTKVKAIPSVSFGRPTEPKPLSKIDESSGSKQGEGGVFEQCRSDMQRVQRGSFSQQPSDQISEKLHSAPIESKKTKCAQCSTVHSAGTQCQNCVLTSVAKVPPSHGARDSPCSAGKFGRAKLKASPRPQQHKNNENFEKYVPVLSRHDLQSEESSLLKRSAPNHGLPKQSDTESGPADIANSKTLSESSQHLKKPLLETSTTASSVGQLETSKASLSTSTQLSVQNPYGENKKDLFNSVPDEMVFGQGSQQDQNNTNEVYYSTSQGCLMQGKTFAGKRSAANDGYTKDAPPFMKTIKKSRMGRKMKIKKVPRERPGLPPAKRMRLDEDAAPTESSVDDDTKQVFLEQAPPTSAPMESWVDYDTKKVTLKKAPPKSAQAKSSVEDTKQVSLKKAPPKSAPGTLKGPTDDSTVVVEQQPAAKGSTGALKSSADDVVVVSEQKGSVQTQQASLKQPPKSAPGSAILATEQVTDEQPAAKRDASASDLRDDSTIQKKQKVDQPSNERSKIEKELSSMNKHLSLLRDHKESNSANYWEETDSLKSNILGSLFWAFKDEPDAEWKYKDYSTAKKKRVALRGLNITRAKFDGKLEALQQKKTSVERHLGALA